VPSGVWSADQYELLRKYDRGVEITEDALGVFLCHQNSRGQRDQLCSGWAACEGHELIGLRLAVSAGRVDPSVLAYATDVPLFATGTEAAEHGLREIENPGQAAVAMIEKIAARRPEVRFS